MKKSHCLQGSGGTEGTSILKGFALLSPPPNSSSSSPFTTLAYLFFHAVDAVNLLLLLPRPRSLHRLLRKEWKELTI